MHASVTEQTPVVKTTHGAVQGQNRRGIAVFRGIPYGGNCGGERRFLPPQPAENWEGVRDCTKNGPVAMQRAGSISAGTSPFNIYFSGKHPEEIGWEDEVFSENCLVLNVLTPGIDEKKRPVVVYIHGGGFLSGSGTLTLGADAWCDEEDIVVVGINHRLNIFGALYLGDLDPKYADSGMAGMLDCVLALEWVRDNIAAFGGDPDRVTIMGESGGGQKVNTLLAMERAKGLFCRAIVESGSGLPGAFHKDTATMMALKVLGALSIDPKDLDKLMDVPAEDLLVAMESTGAVFTPVADEICIPYSPDAYTEADPVVPLMVGASEEELAIFMPPRGDEYRMEDLRKELLDNAEKKAAAGMSGTSVPVTESTVDRFIEQYRGHDEKSVSPYHLYMQMLSMSSLLGAGAFAQAMQKAEKKQGPVYHYFVTYDAYIPGAEQYRYSWHTADLPLQMRVVMYPEMEDLSRKMAHSWAAFIRTGSPDTPELPWPAFSLENRETMVWDEECRVEHDPTKFYRDAAQMLADNESQ